MTMSVVLHSMDGFNLATILRRTRLANVMMQMTIMMMMFLITLMHPIIKARAWTILDSRIQHAMQYEFISLDYIGFTNSTRHHEFISLNYIGFTNSTRRYEFISLDYYWIYKFNTSL